jgi:hypothetical protein
MDEPPPSPDDGRTLRAEMARARKIARRDSLTLRQHLERRERTLRFETQEEEDLDRARNLLLSWMRCRRMLDELTAHPYLERCSRRPGPRPRPRVRKPSKRENAERMRRRLERRQKKSRPSEMSLAERGRLLYSLTDEHLLRYWREELAVARRAGREMDALRRLVDMLRRAVALPRLSDDETRRLRSRLNTYRDALRRLEKR